MSKPETSSKKQKAAKTGRPEAAIDIDELGKLCCIQCTDEEIAHWFGVCTKTIQRARKREPYKSVFEKGAAKGRVSIKRAQWQAAMGGNTAMLIWLGKVMLGQKETVKNEMTGEDGQPIQVARAVKIYLPDNGREGNPPMKNAD